MTKTYLMWKGRPMWGTLQKDQGLITLGQVEEILDMNLTLVGFTRDARRYYQGSVDVFLPPTHAPVTSLELDIRGKKESC
jgi:hypothetical protein